MRKLADFSCVYDLLLNRCCDDLSCLVVVSFGLETTLFSRHRMQNGRQMSFTDPNTVFMCSPDDVFTRKLLVNHLYTCVNVFCQMFE